MVKAIYLVFIKIKNIEVIEMENLNRKKSILADMFLLLVAIIWEVDL